MENILLNDNWDSCQFIIWLKNVRTIEVLNCNIEILLWDSNTAKSYVRLRASCEKKGIPLGTINMLIAAHSAAIGAVLVTNDKAFRIIKHHLPIEDWIVPFELFWKKIKSLYN